MYLFQHEEEDPELSSPILDSARDYILEGNR